MELCLFGAETEYALAAIRSDGTGVDHLEVHEAFMACACEVLPHVPSQAEPCVNLFLTNGGRLYFDSGYRIEYATPEVTTPVELVRYLRAGDAVVGRVARRLAERRPDWSEVFCSRAGVDYLHQTAWAAHESVLLRESDPCLLGEALVPFLVSRIVYAGAGGFDAHGRGIRFLLSPRASFTTRLASSNTMRERPILSTRDESLARPPFRRLHITCGETVCSDLALYLRTGATALVARVLERAPGAASGLALESPVRALHAIAANPRCRRRVPMRDGRRLAATAIQRGYLELVEAGLERGWMPSWAVDVCRRWRSVLDALERDPTSLDTTLDWAIKWTLYRRHLERRGFGRRERVAINRLVGRQRVSARLSPEAEEGAGVPRHVGWRARMPRPSEQRLEGSGLSRADMGRAIVCLGELFELDLRWSELGPRSLFETLDARGCLSHRVEGTDHLDAAIERPPAVGRARIRGEVLRRLWMEAHRVSCDWDRIVDHHTGRTLDLSDPFETEERWV